MAERVIAQRQINPAPQRQVQQRVIPTRVMEQLTGQTVKLSRDYVDNTDEEKQVFTERYKQAMQVYEKYKNTPASSLNLKRTRDILISLFDSDILAWDTETSSLKWTIGKLVCLTFCNDGKKGYYVPWKHIEESEENQLLLLAVFYTCKTMVGANIKFDLHYLMKNLFGFDIFRVKHIDDVGQLSHALNSNRTKGLKPLSYFYTPFGVVRWVHYLPLPLGEVAERSEDGEGNHDHTKR